MTGFYAIHRDKSLDLTTDIESILDYYVHEYRAKYSHTFNQASKNTASSVASQLATDCCDDDNQAYCDSSSNEDSMLSNDSIESCIAYSHERMIADYFNNEYRKLACQFDINKEKNDYSKPFNKLTAQKALDQSSSPYRNSIYNSIHRANTRQRQQLDYSYMIANSFKKQYNVLFEHYS